MTQEKPKILIVDDKPENLYALEKLLKKLDVEVVQALSGAEALSLSLEQDFCVAIVDIQMPEMDGYELVELLRSNEDTATLPVIFVSAIYSDEYHHRKGYEAGAVDFMSKPIIGEILLSKINVFMDLYRQRKALEEANVVLSKRALQLETSSQVSQQVTSILTLDDLLKEVVESIQSKFGFSFVGIWLPGEVQKGQPDKLVLQAGIIHSGEKPRIGASIPLNNKQSVLARVYHTGEACLVEDIRVEARYQALEGLSGTRSQLVLPLRIGRQSIGTLDIRSNKLAAFDAEDQRALQTLANQITIAIRNALVYELEKELRGVEEEKTQALAKLNADKNKFFSLISHDLRGPFNILMGNAQLLANAIDKLSPQDIREMSQSIYNGAKVAYNLLDNLLTWSRMQREEGMKGNPQRLELRDLIQESIEVFEQTAIQKEIDLSNTIAAGLWVQADRYMLETVIRNLTGNAIKFTPRGGRVTLAVCQENVENQPGFLKISVIDTGVGMSQTNTAKLFRIDIQHSTPGTDNEQGSGLGLIICKEMVERNGGQIWAESELGKGTTMIFTIPRAEASPT